MVTSKPTLILAHRQQSGATLVYEMHPTSTYARFRRAATIETHCKGGTLEALYRPGGGKRLQWVTSLVPYGVRHKQRLLEASTQFRVMPKLDWVLSYTRDKSR